MNEHPRIFGRPCRHPLPSDPDQEAVCQRLWWREEARDRSERSVMAAGWQSMVDWRRWCEPRKWRLRRPPAIVEDREWP